MFPWCECKNRGRIESFIVIQSVFCSVSKHRTQNIIQNTEYNTEHRIQYRTQNIIQNTEYYTEHRI